jgi:hypothetical protein
VLSGRNYSHATTTTTVATGGAWLQTIVTLIHASFSNHQVHEIMCLLSNNPCGCCQIPVTGFNDVVIAVDDERKKHPVVHQHRHAPGHVGL